MNQRLLRQMHIARLLIPFFNIVAQKLMKSAFMLLQWFIQLYNRLEDQFYRSLLNSNFRKLLYILYGYTFRLRYLLMLNIGVRRNIQALEVEERKQYFWCLKMLSILPPFEANKKRYFYTFGTKGPHPEHPYNKIEPLCLYDELISSHATGCEHGSFFFGYYHRHLLFYFQVLLNYVHEVLSGTFQDFHKKFPKLVYKETQTHWKEFFEDYHKIAPKQKVMAHYWNPTNYNNADDLIIPKELSDPELLQTDYQLDTLDKLFLQIRKHHHYEINAKHRWYNKEGQLHYESQRKEFIKANSPPPKGDKAQQQYYFYPGYVPTAEEQKLINGNLNARTQSVNGFTEFYDTYRGFASFKDNTYMPTSMRISSSRNFLKFQNPQTIDNMNLVALNQGEILVNYGGRFDRRQKPYNMHYFNESQIPNDVSRIDLVTYNTLIPHYQLGYALYNKKQYGNFIDYLKPSYRNLQRPHNTLHNNMHFSMNNDLYSLTNMMFWPYHSWIDIQVQMKLRLHNTSEQASNLFHFMDSSDYRQQHFDPLLNPNNELKVFGQYPIIQWSDPRFVIQVATHRQLSFEQKVKRCKQLGLTHQDVITAFPAKDFYCRNIKEIRSSKHLGQFYKDNYIAKNTARLAEFAGFANFDASYDIEIFQTLIEDGRPINKTYLLGQLPNVSIPQYLRDMQSQVNEQETFLREFVESYILKLQKPRPVKYYMKLVQKGLLTLVKYKSTITNGNYLVHASFQNLLKSLKQKKYQIKFDQKELSALFDKDKLVCVFTLTIFSKGKKANQCINCGQTKNFIVDMNEQLFVRYRKLWSQVNKFLNRQVIYDTQHPENNLISKDIDLKQILQVQTHPDQFTFYYIKGTQEALFDVYFLSKTQKLTTFNLTLSLGVTTVQQGKQVSIVSKSITGEELNFEQLNLAKEQNIYSYHFDFYNLRDTTPIKRNDLDGLVYSNITLQVFANSQSLNISLPVPNYYELIRYNVVITDGPKLSCRVTDGDFNFKNQYFKHGGK